MGLTHCANTLYHWPGMWACIISLVLHTLAAAVTKQPMLSSVVSINSDMYNIVQRPDEAMLFVMVKALLCLKNILLFRTLKEFILLNIKKPCQKEGMEKHRDIQKKTSLPDIKVCFLIKSCKIIYRTW